MKKFVFLSVFLLFQHCNASFDYDQDGVKIEYNVTSLSKCRTGKDIIRTIFDRGLPYCVRECGLRSHCAALSYKRLMKVCDLFSTVDAGNYSNGSCAYISVSDINVIKKPCDNCSNGQVCDENVKECKHKECLSKELKNGVVMGNVKVKGSTIRYRCNHGHMIVKGVESAVCQDNGTWNATADCKKVPKSCLEMKQCNPLYADGEYWLRPDALVYRKIKVFCSGMSTSTPSEYVSVDKEHNYSYDYGYPPISSDPLLTRYTKIRIDIETMEVDRSDTTFAIPASSTNHYGRGASCDCSGGCPPWKGFFKISTASTGLKFSNQVTWEADGYMPGISDFYRSKDNTVISGKCGGHCGWCNPAGPLTLYYNENDAVEDEKATYPTCIP